MINLTVNGEFDGKTIKEYFQKQGYSTSQIKRFKYDGQILLNGQAVTVRHPLTAGDTLELTANVRLHSLEPSSETAALLYCDKYLYVAAKPCNVATHPDRTHRANTLGNMLASAFGKDFRLRIITRLDKVTSGLVLGALDEITAEKLNAMQLRREIDKTYVAETEGIVPLDCGEINLPLLRQDDKCLTVVSADGKAAQTKYEVIERRASSTIVRLYPLTGRTHQLRAHMAAIGYPIIGDKTYGAKSAERVKLHCERLTFKHPYEQKTVDVCLPCEF